MKVASIHAARHARASKPIMQLSKSRKASLTSFVAYSVLYRVVRIERTEVDGIMSVGPTAE